MSNPSRGHMPFTRMEDIAVARPSKPVQGASRERDVPEQAVASSSKVPSPSVQASGELPTALTRETFAWIAEHPEVAQDMFAETLGPGEMARRRQERQRLEASKRAERIAKNNSTDGSETTKWVPSTAYLNGWIVPKIPSHALREDKQNPTPSEQSKMPKQSREERRAQRARNVQTAIELHLNRLKEHERDVTEHEIRSSVKVAWDAYSKHGRAAYCAKITLDRIRQTPAGRQIRRQKDLCEELEADVEDAMDEQEKALNYLINFGNDVGVTHPYASEKAGPVFGPPCRWYARPSPKRRAWVHDQPKTSTRHPMTCAATTFEAREV